MIRVPAAGLSRGFVPPHPTPFAVWLLRHFGSLYLRSAQGTREIRIGNMQRLHDAYLDFQEGRSRLILLFRHVEVADGPLMMNVLARQLSRYDRRVVAKRDGRRLPKRPHAHFLYGKDVLNWAGAGARWIFPRLGGIPVVNTRMDRRSHATIRDTIVRGEYPLALAPEGQVTYQMFHVSDLSAGPGTMAHWIETDLVSEARKKQPEIVLLPLAIGYHFATDHRRLFDCILKRLEAAVGTEIPRSTEASETLLSATEVVVDRLESWYSTAFPGAFEATPPGSPLSERIPALCNAILRCAELGVRANEADSLLRRLFGVRYRAMDLYHREDVDPRSLPPMDKAWADFRVVDAVTIEHHSQIVDVLMYVRPQYIEGTPCSHRLVEYALNLLDVTNRVRGGNIDSRYSPKGKRARVIVGKPIDGGAVLRDPETSPRTSIAALNRTVYESLRDLSAELERSMTAEARTAAS